MSNFDLMTKDVNMMSSSELRIAVLALRSVVRLERCSVARAEVDSARWMREAASYRTGMAAENLRKAEAENRGEKSES